MKWARKVNNFAVDVRTVDPEGFYTPQVVAEFIIVPDEVQEDWWFNDETQQWQPEAPPPPPPPPPPTPSEETQGSTPNVIV